MNTISLLPPSIKTEKEKSNIYKVFSVSIISLIVLMLIITSIMAFLTFKTRRELQVIKGKNESLHTYIESKDHLIVAYDELLELKSLIEKGMGTAPDWNLFLVELAGNRPNGITITGIRGGYEDTNTSINILGDADNQESIGLFMDGLNKLTNMDKIQCNYISHIESDDNRSLSFEIIVYLKQAEQYKLGDGRG